jgi:hypothetical protein
MGFWPPILAPSPPAAITIAGRSLDSDRITALCPLLYGATSTINGIAVFANLITADAIMGISYT